MFWYLSDYLGTIRDLANNSGEVMNHYIYDSFGNVIAQTDEQFENRYLFTSREFDFKTGLYFYRTRYYNVLLGRFLNEDQISFAGGDANLYRYVGNQPLSLVDPSGMTSVELTALLNIAQPVLPARKIYEYPESLSLNYAIAFAKATTWFYLITQREERSSRDFPNRIRPFPWLISAPLKGPGGRSALRPSGNSGPTPTIDLQEDRFRGNSRHETPGHERATEIKFEYPGNDDDSCPRPIPDLLPAKEPTLEDAPDYRPIQEQPDIDPPRGNPKPLPRWIPATVDLLRRLLFPERKRI